MLSPNSPNPPNGIIETFFSVISSLLIAVEFVMFNLQWFTYQNNLGLVTAQSFL